MRKLGHIAMSCDLVESSGNHPEWHYQEDIFNILKRYKEGIDLFIAHPPCTYLANSDVRWLYNKDGSRNEDRWSKMFEAALFFKQLLNTDCEHIVIENPIMHKHAMDIIGVKPTQIIQPWQFGHGETKATCLWLKGLPKLEPTDIVDGREQKMWKLPPSADRQKLRSKTYPGIAQAIANQWTNYILNK